MAITLRIATRKMVPYIVFGFILLLLRIDGASSACGECCPPSNIRVESSICLSECFDWKTSFSEQDSKIKSTVELLETFNTNFGDLRTELTSQIDDLNTMTSQIQSQIDFQNEAEEGIDEQIEVLADVREVLENNSLSLSLTLDEIESDEVSNMEEENENQDVLTSTCQQMSFNYTNKLSTHFNALGDFLTILNTSTVLTSSETIEKLETASELYDSLMAAVTTENNGQVKRLEVLSKRAKDVNTLVDRVNKNCPAGSDQNEQMVHCCADIYTSTKAAGNTPTDGIYSIELEGEQVQVYCDMTTDGGGWTVFQRRVSNAEGFDKGWEEYVNGFGNLNENFWMGLELMHSKTKSSDYVLRIDMEAFDGSKAFITYDGFGISDARRKYALDYRAKVNGTVDNSLAPNKPFTTKDQDNDKHEENCALRRGEGAWWYNGKCGPSSLNGPYVDDPGQTEKFQGIIWKAFQGTVKSLKFTEMKCRPETFTPEVVLEEQK
ncbi:unnamed protein product [Owenia fusiformis]|uniref:Fibrinogen C-terminal domain-containing protein n=2 Tax=Owenia fusiformis TaxID=6347 RepID=A0A8S4PGU4_OWEFU|nr:unnamed protein product [Owenia fusiformis]